MHMYLALMLFVCVHCRKKATKTAHRHVMWNFQRVVICYMLELRVLELVDTRVGTL